MACADHGSTLLDSGRTPRRECRGVDFDLVAAAPAGFSWHSRPQATELNRGPSPVAGVNTLSNTSLPRANRSSCARSGPDRGDPRAAPASCSRGRQRMATATPGAGHRAPTLTFRLLVRHRPAPVRRPSARTTSPGLQLGETAALRWAVTCASFRCRGHLHDPQRQPDAGDQLERAGRALNRPNGAAIGLRWRGLRRVERAASPPQRKWTRGTSRMAVQRMPCGCYVACGPPRRVPRILGGRGRAFNRGSGRELLKLLRRPGLPRRCGGQRLCGDGNLMARPPTSFSVRLPRARRERLAPPYPV